jgi:single-stranded DNA-binding protein
MDHLNRVELEGYVVYAPDMNDNNGKKALNFLVENRRKGKNETTSFRYNCVAWGSIAERLEGKLEAGDFVRIFGHLQDNVLELPDGARFHYSKTCVDHIETLE